MNNYNSIKIKIIKLDLWVKNLIISLFQRVLFPFDRKSTIKKILIYRIGSIGDNVCALPAINAIYHNYQFASIDILTNPGEYNFGSMDKILKKGLANRIINYKDTSKIALIKSLRKAKYDLYIELPKVNATLFSSIRNIFFAKATGAKYALGWEIYISKIFKQEFNKMNLDRESDRLINILSNKGIKTEVKKYPLNIEEHDEKFIKEILSAKGITDKSKNVAVIPGAKYSYKRWPLEYFQQVISFLTSQGYNVLLVGNEDNSIDGQERVYDFRGKLSLMQSACLFNYCRLAITNDTGPMHIADVMETPLVALFSAADYAGIWYPSPENSIVLRYENLPCSLCLRKNCTDNICMKKITSGFVIDQICRMINIQKPF